MKFDRKREHKRYLAEIDDFIANEIAHADRQVRTFEGGDHTDTRFATSARRYVTALADAFAFSRRRDSKFRAEFLAHFPDIIRDLTTALFQRNEPEPTRAFALTAPHAQFVPSEVTLEYPVTIRAAEALNEYYHERVRGFLLPTSAAPLVNLSGGTVAMLHGRQGLAPGVTKSANTDPLDPRRLVKFLAVIDDLSSITLPRWSSQHIRTYALAAHEHMHRVLSAAFYVGIWANQRYARSVQTGVAKTDAVWASAAAPARAVSPADALDRMLAHTKPLERPLGKNLVELAGIAFSFSQRIWQFYRDWNMRPKASKVDEPVRSIAEAHAYEILADIGALLIAGPAFAFAFRTAYSPAEDEDLEEYFRAGAVPRQHPPSALRARVHIDVLRQLGFDETATIIEKQFDEWALESAKHKGFLTAYATFLRDGLGRIDVHRAIDLFGHVASDEQCYDLNKRARTTSRYSTEAALWTRWVEIARGIEEEGAILPSDVRSMSPSDVINAIWWKRVQNPTKRPTNRMGWRVALRNYRAAARATTRSR